MIEMLTIVKVAMTHVYQVFTQSSSSIFVSIWWWAKSMGFSAVSMSSSPISVAF
jgi:hypothetical protein